ncbi:MAG: ATP-binding cassette domain-containing protein [Patescibacteria group bacterium]
MDKAIIVDHLFKDVSFTLQTGEFVGLLGPKGSGKTTLIKFLSGLKSPNSGFISVLGFDPSERHYDFLRQISVVFSQKNELWEDLSVIKSIEFTKATYSMLDRDYNKNLDELVTLLRTSKLLDIKVKNLSLEQKIKVELIVSLIYKPKVLLLDEPFINFDLKTKHLLNDFIYEYVKRNETTVLLTSDNVNDLIGLVRRVVIIDEEKLLFDGPFEKIK